MQEDPIIFEDRPSEPGAYAALFDTTGWNAIYGCTAEELEASLARSWLVVSAYDDARLVGSGRIVSDGVLYATVFDLVVAPSHQGRGIGSEIAKRLVGACDRARIRDVVLFASRGTCEFYRRFDFEPRPGDAPGMIRRRATTSE